jgi:hypothetical protein
VRDVHAVVGWILIVSNGLAGAWALAAHRYHWLRHRALWWLTAFAEIIVFVQIGLGVVLQRASDIDPSSFHVFYGFVAGFAVMIIYAYRSQLEPWKYLFYGGGGLFLMGLGLRAIAVRARL